MIDPDQRASAWKAVALQEKERADAWKARSEWAHREGLALYETWAEALRQGDKLRADLTRTRLELNVTRGLCLFVMALAVLWGML